LATSVCHLLVKHRIDITCGLPFGFIIGALLLQIPIYLLLTGEIEGDGAVDLF
jgi:hypothetical protein